MLCAAGERASAASRRGCPRVPGGPRSGGIAFEGGTGRWQTSGPTGATSVAGLGQRQCRRELAHAATDSRPKNRTAPDPPVRSGCSAQPQWRPSLFGKSPTEMWRTPQYSERRRFSGHPAPGSLRPSTSVIYLSLLGFCSDCDLGEVVVELPASDLVQDAIQSVGAFQSGCSVRKSSR
jgi:hypothetical protein